MAGASKEVNPADMNDAGGGNNIVGLIFSFVKKFVTVGLVWGCGYMNWSIAWFIGPIILSVLRTEWRRESDQRRLTAQATVLAGEQQMIVNKMYELPSWVYFPDVDRAEWLNKILYKLWPSMNQFVRQLCKQDIEPAVVARLAQYKLKGFSFERLVLGRIPPRIGGIKVYDKNTDRNEIILDADILYAGDCDISFFCSNVKGGIKDFQIRGMIRVVMKPLLSIMPLVGGLQIFFLNMPSVDFNLVGVADVLDMPGLSEVLRKAIVEQIGAIMVLPNKLPITLSPDVPPELLKTPEPEGVLRIHVIEAKDLMKKDFSVLGKGKSDPYAVINVGAQEFKTKTIDNTVNPIWDFWCEAVITCCSVQVITSSLWDWDPGFPCIQDDDFLGRASIEVINVQQKGTLDTWVTLEFAKHGMVHLRLKWLTLSNNVGDLPAALAETQQLRVTSMSTALLILYIDSAKNLPCLRATKQPDVYLEAVLGNRTERTNTMLRSCDPVWEQGFTFLVSNPESDILHLKIVDEKTGMNIGTLSYHLTSLMDKKNLEISQQPFNLQHAQADSRIILSMRLKILKYDNPEPTPNNEEPQDINTLKREIKRQESNISNTPSSSIAPSPLKKQPSKESVASSVISAASFNPVAPIEDQGTTLIQEEIATSAVSVPVNASPQLIRRNISMTSSAGETGLGRIQLTLRYSVARQKLVVVVHKIANLPLPQNDPSNVPDPYVKLYLLPDRHKETKRKTAVMKDNCNPVYDEQFEYIISQGDINTRRLEVSVCTQKGWLSTGGNVMGQVYITLCGMDLTQSNTAWYDLLPANRD
ncbi:extended synaptotagmin-2 isoform X1 [Neodiprion fabricii]|uniref:extended synaptotagmin-2 isoform X1 n=2 Tax=Neodiprion fabricii TaxID=2872261 RepID=UPI001ED8F639|nr:extended synaptotagmin-2 isoform X1 [Neodiprion fabricii]XP_046414184.1 extended synaptotagmin-2 isoform X1 [Neodiprion fabricii]